MKKNNMMRIASVLLVAVLLSTCVISGTFAKYVTSDTATDSARVAKFGVEIVAKTEADNNMFVKTYNDNDGTYNGLSVEATVDVVAPGTSGTLTAFEVTGTPEVAVRVTYAPTLTLEGWTVAEAEYCPIAITVGNETFKVGVGDITTIAELKAAVEAAITAKTMDYEPNTDLSTINDDLTVSWAWDFTGNNDVKDTVLGDADTAATIDLDVVVTITQID